MKKESKHHQEIAEWRHHKEIGDWKNKKAKSKALEGAKQHTPIEMETKERNRIYRKNLKESHEKHLRGEY